MNPWSEEWTKIDGAEMLGQETCEHIWTLSQYNEAELRTCSLCGRVEERRARNGRDAT